MKVRCIHYLNANCNANTVNSTKSELYKSLLVCIVYNL